MDHAHEVLIKVTQFKSCNMIITATIGLNIGALLKKEMFN